MTDEATSVLAPHAANLLFIKGLNFPSGSSVVRRRQPSEPSTQGELFEEH
jgi:hypothetical protein